jgi:hypothetical protein
MAPVCQCEDCASDRAANREQVIMRWTDGRYYVREGNVFYPRERNEATRFGSKHARMFGKHVTPEIA